MATSKVRHHNSDRLVQSAGRTTERPALAGQVPGSGVAGR